MQKFYGIEDINFIWHGEWSDPEIEYKGNLINYYTIESSLYETFLSDLENETNDGLNFTEWVYKNKDLVYEYIDLYLDTENKLQKFMEV